VLPAGGEVSATTWEATGAQQAWFLPQGVTSLGEPPVAEVEVRPDGTAVLRALADPVQVDGRPVHETPLVAGNRIEARGGVLVFQTDEP
jgi:hypothetical protein